MEITVLSCAQAEEWTEWVERSQQHDWYHLPFYHAMAEAAGEGSAHLFVFRDGGYWVALPLLLRPVSRLEEGWGGGELGEWVDAISVTGYPGPVASHTDVPERVVQKFQSALGEMLREMRVVSVFSKLNPLIVQAPWVAGLGECRFTKETVSIDLRLPAASQWSQYRQGHRADISKLRRSGLKFGEDKEAAGLEEFAIIYGNAMDRLHADDSFRYPWSYFENMKAGLGPKMRLFSVRDGTQMVAGGLFVETEGIVQYHLAAAAEEWLKKAPLKLVLDEARLWASEAGHRVLHLGGGVNGAEDTLFHYKAGFSKQRHMYLTWRWVLEPEIYRALCNAKAQWNALNGVQPVSQDFFPWYRCPVVEEGC